MAALKLLVLSLACLYVHAIPQSPPENRNTIFGDEKLEEQIFETLDTTLLAEITSLEGEIAPEHYRLPKTTKPIHYDVFWDIDIGNLKFSGIVEIDLVATQANVNQIVIQADDLEINDYKLEHITGSGNNVDVNVTMVENDVLDFLYFTLNNGTLQYSAAAGEVYRLTIDFEADMRNDMYGIYKSWFKNNYTENVEPSWIATTQFQATSARRAFPCYDEPSFKATFDITIKRPTTHKSWSCTRINATSNSTEREGVAYEEDEYNRTPIMSTYLIAIIVAEYDSLNDQESNNGTLKFEVISRPNAQEDAVYAFEVGQELLDEMSDHTGIDFYSVNSDLKMTQAAIPDFSAGAMENWGLLTYREAYLLYNENHTNKYFKQLIAYILSHEIAHMWFGNLVTCDWWDVLWLNEGFARYYQYFLTYWVEDMGLGTRFINEQVHTSLLADSVNTHPLTHSGVGSPRQVSSMFSTISYNKGASIIRMTEHLLGFEVHREGLRHYLKEKYLDVVLPIDLFESLQKAAVNANATDQYGPNFSVIDYYKSWTEQPGHPVLNVHVNHLTGQITISQRRFDINNGFGVGTANWIIPITFTTGNNPDFENTKPTHIINQTLTIINAEPTLHNWIVFNKQQTGFYRVNYDEDTWNLLVLTLRSNNYTQIHDYNRAQIVNDVFQFARSGLMSYHRAFNILSYLRYETEYAPLVAAITGFTWIRNRLIHTPYLDQLEGLIRNWTNTAITRLGYESKDNELFMDTYLRYQLAPFLCLNNNAECRAEALKQFQALFVNGTDVEVDNRNWVYCNGLRQGNAEHFEFLWDRFKYHNIYTERIVLLQSLGCTTHEASLNRYLEAIFENSTTKLVRPQDLSTAFNSAVTGNEQNTQIVFQFIKDNLPLVSKAYASLSTPLSAIAARLRNVTEINDFRQWVSTNAEALGNDTVRDAERYANDAVASLNWYTTIESDLSNYFENGDDDIVVIPPTGPPSTTVTTLTPSELIEPTTPELPDSAVTSFISTFAILFAAIYHFVL